jgi:hypothetical protein
MSESIICPLGHQDVAYTVMAKAHAQSDVRVKLSIDCVITYDERRSSHQLRKKSQNAQETGSLYRMYSMIN